MALAKSIKEYLAKTTSEKGVWKHKGDIEKVAWFHKDGTTPYLVDTVDRTLRDMESEKQIAQKPDVNSKSILYKYLPEQLRAIYIPYSERPNGMKDKIFIS